MIALQGHKVVLAHEMQRIERLALAQGCSEELFMENAGRAIAGIVDEYMARSRIERSATLLVGRGNNGGDAYVAGRALIEKGCTVHALQIYPTEALTPLAQQMRRRFVEKGGSISSERTIPPAARGVILDGLVGTGFHGKPDSFLVEIIESANASSLPIFAIDIPSGVCGNTGEVESVAISADVTIFLGLPKLGFFFKQGWNYVGELIGVDFGLPEEFVTRAEGVCSLVKQEGLSSLLPEISRSRHKYETGYVMALAGSPGMPGAALLTSLAALRCGAGVVRLFHPPGMEAELSSAPYELIREKWDHSDHERIFAEEKRARSLCIGPGMGRDKSVKKALKMLLPKISLSCVLDADALYHLSENPTWKLPAHCILTPHHQEMARLLGQTSLTSGKKLWLHICQEFAERKKVTLVVKGAPTFVFHPGVTPFVVTRGDPGMATAGTGDVLTGMIAALLAQGLPCQEAAIFGVALHGIAGEIAASEKTSFAMIASDLIEALPKAFSTLL